MSIRAVIVKDGKSREVEAVYGQNVMDLIHKSGFSINAPCAGNHRCGKCAVEITGEVSSPEESELKLLAHNRYGSQVRLACMSYVLGDVTIKLDPCHPFVVQTEGVESTEFPFAPPTRAVQIRTAEMPAAPNDEERLYAAIRAAGAEADALTLSAARVLPDIVRRAENFFAVIHDKTIAVLTEQEPCGIAIDIGTTTVAAYFCSLLDGRVEKVESGHNAQADFGADVISRIQYGMENEDGLDVLADRIIGQIDAMCADFCETTGNKPECISAITISGNTVMEHLAAHIRPDAIANAPFVPATLFGDYWTAADLGFKNVQADAPVFFVPSVAGYVGGDITAGIVAVGMDKMEGMNLFLDIGTNGEMALGGKDGIYTCATAAGPAFEGAHITCGMSSTAGAISGVSHAGGYIRYDVIGPGGTEPRGICGSALIDSIAIMLETGFIDETGRIEDLENLKPETQGYATRMGDETVFALSIGSKVYITQEDVREVQLAKSAIAAGIDTMLEHAGVELKDISRVFVAGGFGAHINKKNACAIGLLPKVLSDRMEFVGNASGAGARSALLSSEAENRMIAAAHSMKYLELSGDPYFQDAYIENMMFEEE